jgi:hypothetical protein
VQIVASVPQVFADVGRIGAVAPTANDHHVYARTMDGDEMRFALDILGEKGAGVFRTSCTVMGNVTEENSLIRGTPAQDPGACRFRCCNRASPCS